MSDVSAALAKLAAGRSFETYDALDTAFEPLRQAHASHYWKVNSYDEFSYRVAVVSCQRVPRCDIRFRAKCPLKGGRWYVPCIHLKVNTVGRSRRRSWAG